MPRPRAFERTQALDQAMEAFWDLGYEQTSTAILEERMGIGRSSLYAAFGSKDELYVEAMDRYIADLRGRVIDALAAEGPALGVLRTFFDVLTRRGEAGGEPLRCCMIVRASTSSAGRSPEVASRIAETLAELDDAFLAVLKRARDEGVINATGSLRGLARFLTTTFQGVNVAANAGRTRRELQDIIRPALRAITSA